MKDLWYNCEESGRRFIFNSTRILLVEANYDLGPADPLQGSDYECEGLVIGLARDDDYPLEVHWDNGNINQYKADDLEIVDHLPIKRPIKPTVKEDDPNRAFRAHKRSKSNITNVNYTNEVIEVNRIREALGLSIPEAHSLYTLHNGDVDAAITYYNLEHGSAARSVGVGIEMTSEEFDDVQSAENMANRTTTAAYIDAQPSYYDEEGVFSKEGTKQVLASKGHIVTGGCDPISSKEIARRADLINSKVEASAELPYPPRFKHTVNYTGSNSGVGVKIKKNKDGFWEKHKKKWRGQGSE